PLHSTLNPLTATTALPARHANRQANGRAAELSYLPSPSKKSRETVRAPYFVGHVCSPTVTLIDVSSAFEGRCLIYVTFCA
ncbi:hypothetical protein AVEN_67378-1, partial [Araneus ventricosus]